MSGSASDSLFDVLTSSLCCIGQRYPWQIPNTSPTIAFLRFAPMVLEITARVGPYEILSALGAGGMDI